MPGYFRCLFVLSACLLWLPLFTLSSLAQNSPKKPLDLQTEVLKQARWRSIGPAVMGGRIADIAVDEKNPYTFYVALATGGVLKTTNDGTTWTPVFDKAAVASV